MNEHMKKAANVMGSAAALASAIGVSPQFMSQMIRGDRKVPAEQCPRIEELTGVRCEDLRPDVAWSVLRDSQPKAPATISNIATETATPEPIQTTDAGALSTDTVRRHAERRAENANRRAKGGPPFQSLETGEA